MARDSLQYPFFLIRHRFCLSPPGLGYWAAPAGRHPLGGGPEVQWTSPGKIISQSRGLGMKLHPAGHEPCGLWGTRGFWHEASP